VSNYKTMNIIFSEEHKICGCCRQSRQGADFEYRSANIHPGIFLFLCRICMRSMKAALNNLGFNEQLSAIEKTKRTSVNKSQSFEE